MKDYLGQELKIGDKVLLSNESGNGGFYPICRIIAFKPQKNGDFVEVQMDHGYVFKKRVDKVLNVQYNIDKINNG